MAEAVIRELREDTLDDYRLAAAAEGRSMEDSLRELIERNRPFRLKNPVALLRLADELQAMTPEGPDGSDSTLFIRWDRDTNHGKWVDDGWTDDDAGG